MYLNDEQQAILIAEKYKGHVTDIEKVKHLAGEVVELMDAIVRGDKKEITGEIGDCAFLLSHLLYRHGEGQGLISEVTTASIKMERRES